MTVNHSTTPEREVKTSRRPTLAYPGGKAKLAQKLVSLMPKTGRLYLEPCAGRGKVFWTAVVAERHIDRAFF